MPLWVPCRRSAARSSAARARDPAAGQLPARDPHGAEPDPLAPGLARHLRAGPRRDLDVLLLLPRARPDPRPLRDVHRPAHAHALLPGRRRLRGHPASASSEGPRVLRRDAVAASTSTRRSSTATRSSSSAPRASGSSRASGCSSSASPGRCCAPPASPGTCARSPPTSPTTTSTSRSRWARSATATTATACRIAEMRESVKIIEQCLDGLPEGPWIADDRKVVLPPRHELSTSMEALIHHFKLVTEGFRVPPGEIYYPIESPRGELGCFVARRRLGEAGAGPLPRPLLRQPAGAARHVRRRLRRRPDPEPGDARPDPRRHRPMSERRRSRRHLRSGRRPTT